MRLTYSLGALAVSAFMGISAMANPVDVTSQYLRNYTFDYESSSSYTRAKDNATKIDNNSDAVENWSFTYGTDHAYGTIEYGSGALIKGQIAAPSAGFNGSTGGCLAMAAAWSANMIGTQDVTLPAGKYTLTTMLYVPYGSSTNKNGNSKFGWVPDGGTAVLSGITSYPTNKWVAETVSFTLTEETSGKIQIGYTSTNQGSGGSPQVCYDFVKLYYTPIDAEPGTNMLINASFENAGEGWNNITKSGDTSFADNLLSMTSKNGDNVVSQPIDMDPAKTYTFYAKYKGTGNKNIFAGFWNKSGFGAGWYNGAPYKDVAAADDWTTISYTTQGQTGKALILACNGTIEASYKDVAVFENPTLSVLANDAAINGEVDYKATISVFGADNFTVKYQLYGADEVELTGNSFVADKGGLCIVKAYYDDVEVASSSFTVANPIVVNAPVISFGEAVVEGSDAYQTVSTNALTLTGDEGDVLEYKVVNPFATITEWTEYVPGTTLKGGHQTLSVRAYKTNGDDKFYSPETSVKLLVPASEPASTYKVGDEITVENKHYNVTETGFFNNGFFTEGFEGWTNGTRAQMTTDDFYIISNDEYTYLTRSRDGDGGQGSVASVYTYRLLEPGKYYLSFDYKSMPGGFAKITLGSESKINATGDGEVNIASLDNLSDWNSFNSMIEVTEANPYLLFSMRWINGQTNKFALANVQVVKIALDNVQAWASYIETRDNAKSAINALEVSNRVGAYSQEVVNQALAGIDAIDGTVTNESDTDALETAMAQIEKIVELAKAQRIQLEYNVCYNIKHVLSGKYLVLENGKFSATADEATPIMVARYKGEDAQFYLKTPETHIYASAHLSNSYDVRGWGASDKALVFYPYLSDNGELYLNINGGDKYIAADNAEGTLYCDKSKANATENGRGLFVFEKVDYQFNEKENLLANAFVGNPGTVPAAWTGYKRNGESIGLNGGATLRDAKGATNGGDAVLMLPRWDGDKDMYYTYTVEVAEPGAYDFYCHIGEWNNFNASVGCELPSANTPRLRVTFDKGTGFDYGKQSYIVNVPGRVQAGTPNYADVNLKFNAPEAGTYYLSLVGPNLLYAMDVISLTKSAEETQFAAAPEILSNGAVVDDMVIGGHDIHHGDNEGVIKHLFIKDGDNGNYEFHTGDIYVGEAGMVYAYEEVDGVHGAVAVRHIDINYPTLSLDHFAVEGADMDEDGTFRFDLADGAATLTFNHPGYMQLFYKFADAGWFDNEMTARRAAAAVPEGYTEAQPGESLEIKNFGTYTMIGSVNGVNSEPMTMAFDMPTGVKGINLDVEGAEIYTLNGVRVNNETLTPGTYVIRKGNKAFKVIVK